MNELELNEMETITAGADDTTVIPYELLRPMCQSYKKQGMSIDEAVIAAIKYFKIPLSYYSVIRSYISGIWDSL